MKKIIMNDSDDWLTFWAMKWEVLSVSPEASPFSFSFIQCNVQSNNVVLINFEAVFHHHGNIFIQK